MHTRNQTIGNKTRCRDLYLDYLNNFLTVEKFAVWYSIDLTKANRILNIGRNLMKRVKSIH